MKVRGRVEQGSRRGRELGYPTANIAATDIPADFRDGVYAATAQIGRRCYGALAYLGTKPTFTSGGGRVLELHLLGFEGGIYGEELEADLLEFVRPDRKFASQEELLTQIGKDRENILKILKARKCI